MKLLIIPLLATIMLSGCATFDLSMLGDLGVDPEKALDKAKGVEDAVLGNAVKPLPIYCKAPPVARDVFRARVNARPESQGAQIGVWCPGDPPLTLGE